MKLSANYYNSGTKSLIRIEKFKTIKWLTAPEPSKVNTTILKSYNKISKEITHQWPQL